MSYRVVIPTAGTGSRLGNLTKYINKSLVSIAHRPTISHLIEQFPEDCEFVIAIGHKGKLVRDYLELAYPSRQFFFANVDPFEGEGSGLGLSLLACEKHLQEPFVFISCDTLVSECIHAPDHNWMGYAQVNDAQQYRTILLQNKFVKQISEKGVLSEQRNAYIGLSGINDYQSFWDAMHEGGHAAVTQGESFGLREIIDKTVVSAYEYTWFDMGMPEVLALTRDAYRQPNEPNILEKENEAIWFVGKNVIKYSDDKNFISNRVERVKELKTFVPEIFASTENMYCYRKVNGNVLSDVITLPLFEGFMLYCQDFWVRHDLNNDEVNKFKDTCFEFYKDKTYERVDLFYNNFNKKDGTESINGIAMPPLSYLLESVDWEWMSNGVAGRFHGDFHFENILWEEHGDKFTFLDWRQDFGGDLHTGDIYYDLAKLMHGLIVSHEMISKKHYAVDWCDNRISYVLYRKQILVECERSLNEWIINNGYDLKKVNILTAIIYLNIAALHHFPYSLMLFSLGKEMLNREVTA
jgi:choline kinase